MAARVTANRPTVPTANANGDDSIGESVTTPTTPSRYRPPAGFMNEALAEDETKNMQPEEMMRRIQSRHGRWYTFAKMCSNLYKQDFNSGMVSEMTGVDPLQQNRWIVAGTVYESIKHDVPPEVLKYFEDQSAPVKLEPFRYLDIEMRVDAALYMAANDLQPEMCETLARSMKEWERRPIEREGFSSHPGDCLAFMYFRGVSAD
ncbi:hypothetical protein FOA52_002755 [Chlamydomonas sp. UWO 241]|nr:hypothetical protein FOA52_002755 [Chlamydomonas sp. UWO 241]